MSGEIVGDYPVAASAREEDQRVFDEVTSNPIEWG